MQKDFHYYATYCAAILAGFSPADSEAICYSAQFVDHCSPTLLHELGGPRSAATTQLQSELINTAISPVSLQNITRIWASFHFLPYDLSAKLPRRSKAYMDKYRLICKPNGALVADTVELAKRCGSLQAIGIAMHILADTWAHSYFAGTPSLVINDTNFWFDELIGADERRLSFRHNPGAVDDPRSSSYVSALRQANENSVMNLGHGRAGHLPDYSYIRYRYMPAWGDYDLIVKDNPSEYYQAFCQMVYALESLRGQHNAFSLEQYAQLDPSLSEEVHCILKKRQLDACDDWSALAVRLSGHRLEDFSVTRYREEYRNTPKFQRYDTFLGRFFLAAMAQKSMVTGKIFRSGNLIAGFSVDYSQSGFRGIREYRKLIELWNGGDADERR